jgi:tetratricopeptide (TPR) repeat protein
VFEQCAGAYFAQDMISPNKLSASFRTRARVAALILCLGAALAAALVSKHLDAPPGPIPAASTRPPAELTPEQILAAIPALAGNSETDKALAATLAKARQNPRAAVAWVNLGDALAQKLRDSANLKCYDYAEIVYRKALQLDPRNVDAMNGMAWVVGGRHVFYQSIEWANRALEIDPGNAPARGIIGDAALELGDYDRAFDEYQKMMDLRPDLSSWSRGAYLLWLTGNPTKAIWLMQKAIKAGAPYAENTAWCRAKLATMLFQDGALLPAEEVLAPALVAAPHNTQVVLVAGRIAAARHDFAAATRYYQTVLDTAPNHEALTALGDLHVANGEKEKAEEYYKKVEALHAAHLASGVHSHMLMAKFYADHDRNLVEALRLAEQRKLTRNVLEADILAWVYFKSGDLPHAREAIKRALSRDTPDAEMHYHAGMIAAASGDPGAAQKELGKALSLNPKFSLLQAPIAHRMLDQVTGRSVTKAEATQLATVR